MRSSANSSKYDIWFWGHLLQKGGKGWCPAYNSLRRHTSNMNMHVHLGRMRFFRHTVKGGATHGLFGFRAEALAGPPLCKPVVNDLGHLEGVPPGNSPVSILVLPHLPCNLLCTSPTQLNRCMARHCKTTHRMDECQCLLRNTAQQACFVA